MICLAYNKSAFQGSCSYSTSSQSTARVVVISKASSPMAKLLVSIFLLYRQQVREWLAISSQENLCSSSLSGRAPCCWRGRAI